MDIVNNPFKGDGTLHYRGKDHKVKMTLNAYRLMTVQFKIGLDAFDEEYRKDPLTTLAALTYCALQNGAMAQNKKFEDDFDTFCAFFYEDETGMESMNALFDAANPSPVEDENGDTEGNA